jgi:hypothetical protein
MEDMSIFGSIEEAAATFATSACAWRQWFPVAVPNSQDVSQATPNVLTPANTRTSASEMANRMFMEIEHQLVCEENPLKTPVSFLRDYRHLMLPSRRCNVCALLLRFGCKAPSSRPKLIRWIGEPRSEIWSDS